MTRKLVVLDDVGASVVNSSFVATNLSQIIDTRYRNNLATIYTSNLSPDELNNNMGARLVDRICSDVVIRLQGSSHRQSTSVYNEVVG